MGPEKTERGWQSVPAGRRALALVAASVCIALAGCGTAGGSSGTTTPPPPASITVSVSPATGTLFPGQQLQFSATVSGTTNTAVSWQVNGTGGGGTTFGTISAQGLYTAPSVLPSNPAITIRAVSQADTTAAGTATVTLTSDVAVTVTPASASVPVGTSEQFTAQVSGTGTPATTVTWSLTGSACPTACGTLSASGNTASYTAPATVPSSPSVSVVATSVADASKSATAAVTIAAACSPAMTISPSAASLTTGATQGFTASVCFSTNQSVTWAVSGAGCGATNCGAVSSTGTNTATYTAPASLPPANPVTLTATSAADTSQSASASITITAACSPAVGISPSAATVALGQQQSFTASVCFSTNQGVTWAVSGAGCGATNCGTVSSTGTNTATYTAPAALPPANPVTLTATSMADTSQSGTASITVVSGVTVAVQPLTSELATSHRVSLSATVGGSTDTAVTWSVDGVANGDASVGQICVAGSNPCAAPSGPQSSSVDFLAPGTVPSPSGVSVTATADADSSAQGTGEVTVLAHPEVTLWPANSAVAGTGTVEFIAGVTGAANTAVTWQVACAGSACGTITSGGIYTAPATAPAPNAISVTATSEDDPSQSASATVAIASAVSLRTMAPASVTAGAAASFPVALSGYSFVATNPGPGTSLLVNGVARSTTCASTIQCTTTIDPADVAAAGKVTIQAKNPDGTLSNSLSLVVAPADGAADVISLGPGTPVAGAKDVVAVEPTDAGAGSSASPMAVIFLGIVDTATSTCSVNESPLTLTRPATGTADFTICVAGEGIDASDQVELAGSQASGVTVSNVGSFSGSLVELTLTVSSSAAPGPRALIFTDGNNNRAVASGAIDVE